MPNNEGCPCEISPTIRFRPDPKYGEPRLSRQAPIALGDSKEILHPPRTSSIALGRGPKTDSPGVKNLTGLKQALRA